MRTADDSDEAEYTVLGASGFIGRHLVAHLRNIGATYYAPSQWTDDVFRRSLGHVIYCIGLTADWRSQPHQTVHAHVGRLLDVLDKATYRSVLYLSSTRVYKRSATATEDSSLVACPAVQDDLFDLSKMMGESLCLSGPETLRVVRLSNVFGSDYRSDNFLSSVIRDALRGRVVLQTNPHSAKDYIGIDDVVNLLLRIATGGNERIYNVASGMNTRHQEVLAALVAATGCSVQTDSSAREVTFPQISVEKIASEFGFIARPVVQAIGPLVNDFRVHRNEWEST